MMGCPMVMKCIPDAPTCSVCIRESGAKPALVVDNSERGTAEAPNAGLQFAPSAYERGRPDAPTDCWFGPNCATCLAVRGRERAEPDAELDSPNFVPQAAKDLEARRFERINRAAPNACAALHWHPSLHKGGSCPVCKWRPEPADRPCQAPKYSEPQLAKFAACGCPLCARAAEPAPSSGQAGNHLAACPVHDGGRCECGTETPSSGKERS